MPSHVALRRKSVLVNIACKWSPPRVNPHVPSQMTVGKTLVPTYFTRKLAFTMHPREPNKIPHGRIVFTAFFVGKPMHWCTRSLNLRLSDIGRRRHLSSIKITCKSKRTLPLVNLHVFDPPCNGQIRSPTYSARQSVSSGAVSLTPPIPLRLRGVFCSGSWSILTGRLTRAFLFEGSLGGARPCSVSLRNVCNRRQTSVHGWSPS